METELCNRNYTHENFPILIDIGNFQKILSCFTTYLSESKSRNQITNDHSDDDPPLGASSYRLDYENIASPNNAKFHIFFYQSALPVTYQSLIDPLFFFNFGFRNREINIIFQYICFIKIIKSDKYIFKCTKFLGLGEWILPSQRLTA